MELIFLYEISYLPQSYIAPFLPENLENLIDREKSRFTQDTLVFQELIFSNITHNLERLKRVDLVFPERNQNTIRGESPELIGSRSDIGLIEDRKTLDHNLESVGVEAIYTHFFDIVLILLQILSEG